MADLNPTVKSNLGTLVAGFLFGSGFILAAAVFSKPFQMGLCR